MADRLERKGDDRAAATVQAGGAPARAAPAALLATFAATARRMPPTLVAVLDGGHFDDLPATLADADLSARSLFLAEAGRDVQRHGPWFLPITRPERLETVLTLVADRPATVLWSCNQSEMVLYDHLRRLNLVRLPRWAAIGKTGPEPGVDIDRGWDTALFRHWDPRVLASVLPVLDEGQFSRILGPARQILFCDLDQGGAKQVVADPAWPIQPRGMLTLRAEQIEALQQRFTAARRDRVATYLREVAAPEVGSLSAADLSHLIVESERTGQGLRLASDQGHARWAYVMLRTRGRALEQPGLREYITDGRLHPDQKVKLLLETMAATEAAQERAR